MVATRRLTELAGATALLPEGACTVALSGGADSAVVAWAARRQGREVRAIHVNHGLAASGLMQKAAEAVASALDVELAVFAVRLDRASEGEAREKRHATLRAALTPGEWLVTGHTADDQAETVMMNLLRGSGVTGLAGMKPVDPPIARPLLSMWRSEIRELAALAELPFADDPANEDLRHFRNRVRLNLLPSIEADFNPAFRRVLVRNAEVLAGSLDGLERLGRGVRLESREGGVRMVAGELAAADQAGAASAVRRALALLRSPHPPSAAEVEVVLALAVGGSESIRLSGGVVARRSGPWLSIEFDEPRHTASARTLEAPGVTRFGGFRFEVTTTETRPLVPLSSWAFVAGSGASLVVRAASDGGTVAGKEVASALSEAGIPASKRADWPVVEWRGEAVWIPGVRRAGWPGGDVERYLCAVATEDAGWERSEP